jgi:hypothetical protein
VRRTALLLALAGCFGEPPEIGNDTDGTSSRTTSATSSSTSSMTTDPTGDTTSSAETVEPTTASTTATSTTASESTGTGVDPTTNGSSSFCGLPVNLGARLCEDFDDGPLGPEWNEMTINGSVTIDMAAAIGSPPNGLLANIPELAASSGNIARTIPNDPAVPITVAATVRVDAVCGMYTHVLGVLFMDGDMQSVFRVYATVIDGFINIIDVETASGDQNITPTPHVLEVGQVGRISMDIDTKNNAISVDLDGTVAGATLIVPDSVASTADVRILAGLPAAIGFGPCETSTDDILVP